MIMNENEILDPLLECFGGSDGGMSFINLRVFLKIMVERANNGEIDAEKVLSVAERFIRLVEVAQNV
jgi:hypothetical protein